MIHRDTPSTKAPAISRTWQTVTYDRMDGSIVQVRRHTVTLSRVTGTLTAEIDGKAADVFTADNILRGADFRTVTAETLVDAPAQSIGNATACELHKELARLRFTDHYGTASDALGYPVDSLAALTADEAYTVWSYARGQWGLSA